MVEGLEIAIWIGVSLNADFYVGNLPKATVTHSPHFTHL